MDVRSLDDLEKLAENRFLKKTTTTMQAQCEVKQHIKDVGCHSTYT